MSFAYLEELYRFTLLADQSHSLMYLGRPAADKRRFYMKRASTKLSSPIFFDICIGTLSKQVRATGGSAGGKLCYERLGFERHEKVLSVAENLLPISSHHYGHNYCSFAQADEAAVGRL
jgi:hypothetical protein